VLAGSAVVADCDVDAADLHLILKPEVRERHEFVSGREAVIRQEDCTGCGVCRDLCRYGAIVLSQKEGEEPTYRVDRSRARAAVSACISALKRPSTSPSGPVASGWSRARGAGPWCTPGLAKRLKTRES
jgi:ferredoxin